MIAKIKRGNGFRGVLDYALKKEGGELIGGNMLGQNPRELASEFKITRGISPTTKNPVWHCSLALPPGDKLTDLQWSNVAERYTKELGFKKDHQLVVIKHTDTEHPHIHIIASRISYKGELYGGQNDGLKSQKILPKYEKEYGLTVASRLKPEKKSLTKAEREKAKRVGQLPPRKKIQQALDEILAGPQLSAGQLSIELQKNGIEVKYNTTKSGDIRGVSFQKDGLTFKGSSIGKLYSWNKINKQIKETNNGNIRYIRWSRKEKPSSLQLGYSADIRSFREKTRRHVEGNQRPRKSRIREEIEGRGTEESEFRGEHGQDDYDSHRDHGDDRDSPRGLREASHTGIQSGTNELPAINRAILDAMRQREHQRSLDAQERNEQDRRRLESSREAVVRLEQQSERRRQEVMERMQANQKGTEDFSESRLRAIGRQTKEKDNLRRAENQKRLERVKNTNDILRRGRATFDRITEQLRRIRSGIRNSGQTRAVIIARIRDKWEQFKTFFESTKYKPLNTPQEQIITPPLPKIKKFRKRIPLFSPHVSLVDLVPKQEQRREQRRLPSYSRTPNKGITR